MTDIEEFNELLADVVRRARRAERADWVHALSGEDRDYDAACAAEDHLYDAEAAFEAWAKKLTGQFRRER